MTKYTWNDTVRVNQNARSEWRPGAMASVVGMSREDQRRGDFLKAFPAGMVYTIEFGDGTLVEVDELSLERVPEGEPWDDGPGGSASA
jgi:hypothetical protein